MGDTENNIDTQVKDTTTKTFKVDDLSEEAKANLGALQFSEVEVKRLQAQLAIAQTAVMSYRAKLTTLLPQD